MSGEGIDREKRRKKIRMFVILLMFNITSIVKACIYGTYSL
jgi:hypothetical protein